MLEEFFAAPINNKCFNFVASQPAASSSLTPVTRGELNNEPLNYPQLKSATYVCYMLHSAPLCSDPGRDVSC